WDKPVTHGRPTLRAYWQQTAVLLDSVLYSAQSLRATTVGHVPVCRRRHPALAGPWR
ncbi:MAG: hypothetical protein AVDCRST_MAG93-903, partial [uncultured Chloroflexia bacterium]